MTALPAAGPPRRRRTAAAAAGARRHAARRHERLRGPVDLILAVPYLLGFRPAESLALVGMAAGRLVVTARLDLPDAAHHDVLAHTVAAMCSGGAERLVAVRYDDSRPLPEAAWPAEQYAALDAAAVGQGCDLLDVLAVARGRWRSLSCDDLSCCPPDGSPLPEAPSAFAAAATVDGVVVLEDRSDLERLLEPLPAAARERLTPAVETGAPARGGRSELRGLLSAARAADAGWPEGPPSDGEVARFAAALRSIEIRDAVWMGIESKRVDGRELWRELARRAPAPYDAAALFLHGWANWREGNGALANIAVSRALASDPDYSAADLLLAALSRGVDPRRFPRLRLPHPA